jgi:hypothetical protein
MPLGLAHPAEHLAFMPADLQVAVLLVTSLARQRA